MVLRSGNYHIALLCNQNGVSNVVHANAVGLQLLCELMITAMDFSFEDNSKLVTKFPSFLANNELGVCYSGHFLTTVKPRYS